MALAGIVSNRGLATMQKVVRTIRQTQPNSGLVSEASVNGMGYNLLGQKKYAEAVAILRMNTEDFPKSANTWDSLGEALFDSGDLPHALENDQPAREIDPKDPGAPGARKFLAEHEPGKNQAPQ
jgi:tetratricopeptide (TPR) repeat protein